MNHSSAALIPRSNNRAQHLQLSALIACSIALWWQPLTSTLKLALNSDAYTHILLIVPLSVALIYVNKKDAEPVSAPGWPRGAIPLFAALLLRGFTAWNLFHLSSSSTLSLSMLGAVLWWIGSVILCFGLNTFRAFFFPLCFLLLVVPFPDGVVNWMMEFLQHQSAIAATLLFRAARVPVARDGIILSIPGLDLEVARECSSIRSSTILIVITLVLAHLFLRSKWRKVLLFLAAIPLSVLKNAIRIFTIAELGTRVDPTYLDGKLHHNGGIVFLTLALIIIVLLLWGLRSGEIKPVPAS